MTEPVVVVTGGAGGISRGAACALADAGWWVVVNDLDGDGPVQETLDQIRNRGGTAVSIPADVSDEQQVSSLIEQATAWRGRLDALVVSHAYSVREPVLTASPEGIRRTVDVMQLGVVRLCQHAARQMSRQQERGESKGKIVIVGSVRAFLPIAGSAAYNMAKAAVNHFGRTLAAELAHLRINVNMIDPGWIDTPGERQHYTEEQLHAAGAAVVPWGRLGRPSDIGRAVTFLTSPDADYITGAELLVDGGFVLGRNHYQGLDDVAGPTDGATAGATDGVGHTSHEQDPRGAYEH